MPPALRPDRTSAPHRAPNEPVPASAGASGPAEPHVRPGDGRPAPAETGPALPGAGILAIAFAGLALGLSATALVLVRGWNPGAVAVGPWMARPQAGTVRIDPYARAELARSGGVPLAANEGIGFVATTDDTGYRLLRNCSYRLDGAVPTARFWTLTATGAGDRTMDDAAQRSAFTSATVVRDIAGRFAIAAGPAARPGNWLPLSGDGPLTLTLRLYDTPLAGNPAEVASAALPSITRLSCTAASGEAAR